MTELTLPPSPNWYCPKVIDMDSTGKLAFGARQDVHIFNTADFPPIYLGVFGLHRDRISAVALCPPHYSSPSCCSASEDGKVKVWNTETKALQHEHNTHNGKVTGLSWSSVQEDLIVSGDDKGELVVWQLNDARIQTYCPEKGGIFCLAFSPFSAACVAVGYRTGVIVLVDVKKEGTILQRLRGHDEDIQSLVWCPVTGEDFTMKDTPNFGVEGHLLASGSRDRTIRIWSTSKGRQLSLFRVPKPGGYFQRGDQEAGRGKVWIALAWSQSNPRQIISGSFSGDLLLWEVGKEEKQKPQPFSLQERRMTHNRVVFNLCIGGNGILCSVSMDRQVIFWNIDKGIPLCALPTLGGFVYVAKTSPVDPGRLAVGVGDNMIRIWNLNSKWNVFDVSCLWQGIKTKVTAISWHPTKEGLLAYGTEDGRVGIYDTLSNKSPNISSTYHKKIVYVVAWGPPSGTTEAGNDGNPAYVIYSIGDGIILTHNPQKLHTEALDVNTIITSTNGQKVKLPIRSEISWSPDFSFVAVGNDDGSVEIFRPPNLSLVCTVHVHKKLINSISWHPYMTSKSPVKSPYKHWIATGSNESYIHIVDLSNILDSEQNTEPVVVTASKRGLDGHFGRITGVMWSPHIDGQLASVSYDGQARVYDMDTGQVLAQYCRHEGKLLCVVWSGTDSDVIFTGADDFSFHKWRISKHPPSFEEHTSQRRRHPKKRPKGKKIQEVPSSGDTEGNTKPEVNGADSITITGEDKEDLESMLEQKKEELQKTDDTSDVNKSGEANKMPCINGIEDFGEETSGKKWQVIDEDVKLKPTHNSSSQISTHSIDLNKASSLSTNDSQKEVQRYTKSDFPRDQKKKKAWKAKSFFPVTNKFENKSKESVLEDIVTLAKCVFGHNHLTAKNSDPDLNGDEDYLNDEDDTENYDHLGLFLDRRAMFRCLKQEGQYHRDHDNMDYFYQLEIWKGNINGALRLAREREELSDWLVAMAPMAAFDTWITICEDYATQLEADGQYHKAATYLLAAHKVYGAIELFKRHRLFKEAIAVAKVRLSPFDPVLEDLYMLWAHQLTKDGNYEQAAKCHLAMKQVQDAALLLARRYNQSSLQTAARISLIANEKQQALVYGQKVIQNNLLQSDWNEAYKFLKGQKNLQALLAVAGMHELLVREVTHGNPVLLSVNQDKFTTWEDISSQKSFLPDFILDSEVTDPVLPWQPHLIAGHTFPHHVLRIWYGNLGITMDTASIEEMYRALSVLHAGRQVQSDIQQLLVDVSIDLVLCMLSLLMSETPTAITHLLQAVSSLHDAEHSAIMEILLRRFLPQGPKYILKLQQEVTAMRVVISMESSSRIDGASKVHTIKRYLSELKEEDSVSNRGLRCRELDCLRAYYYLSILYYLRKRVLERETTATKENEEKVVEMIEKLDLENNEKKENNLVEKSSSLKLDSANDVDNSVVSMETKPELKIVDSTSEINESDEKSVLIDSNTSLSSEYDSEKSLVKSEQENVKSSSSVDASEINREANKMVENKASDTGAASCDKVDSKKISDKDEPIDVGASACDKSDDTPILPPFDISKKSYGNVEKPLPEDKNKDGSENDTFLLKYHLTISKLSHLSRGLLWDIQGKRYALTETLGYIHKAISQLLLAQRPSSLSSSTQSENAPPEPSTNEIPQAIGGSLVPEPMSVDMGEVSSPLERLAFDDNFPSIEQHSCKKRHLSESAVSPPKINVGSGSHHHDHNCPIFSRSVSADPTTDNQSFDIHIPHHGHLCVSSTDDADSGLFDLCSSCELITKSRKVLWEDEPRFPFESIDHGKGKLTSIVNPAKYINVPDEWYNMAADQKYFMPYVTMAILKDEQEYMMHELKRGPDAIQVPFPNPMDSVKILLSMCSSDLFTQAERNQFAEKVISWAMKFSVSTQQKDVLLESLHKIQTHE